MAINDFLPFCPTDSGTNLLTESEYLAAPNRDVGNQPGVASAKLVNKALRQPTYFVSQLAQLISDQTGTNVLDDATPARLLAQLNAVMTPLAPVITRYASGSFTHNTTYYFFIATGSATNGATYTNNSFTYTVVGTVAAGLRIKMTGPGAPTVSGTLTKASGTGDASLTFFAYRAPITMRVHLLGAGGGGGGSGNTSGNGNAGSGNSTFDGVNLVAGAGGGGGAGSGNGGGGGGSTIIAPWIPILMSSGGKGTSGNGSGVTDGFRPGGIGGGSFFGGFGAGNQSVGDPAAPSSGSGGGGAGSNTNTVSFGAGGGAGAFLKAQLNNPSSVSTWPVVIGSGGVGGTAGTAGSTGGAGADGLGLAIESFQ